MYKDHLQLHSDKLEALWKKFDSILASSSSSPTPSSDSANDNKNKITHSSYDKSVSCASEIIVELRHHRVEATKALESYFAARGSRSTADLPKSVPKTLDDSDDRLHKIDVKFERDLKKFQEFQLYLDRKYEQAVSSGSGKMVLKKELYDINYQMDIYKNKWFVILDQERKNEVMRYIQSFNQMYQNLVLSIEHDKTLREERNLRETTSDSESDSDSDRSNEDSQSDGKVIKKKITTTKTTTTMTTMTTTEETETLLSPAPHRKRFIQNKSLRTPSNYDDRSNDVLADSPRDSKDQLIRNKNHMLNLLKHSKNRRNELTEEEGGEIGKDDNNDNVNEFDIVDDDDGKDDGNSDGPPSFKITYKKGGENFVTKPQQAAPSPINENHETFLALSAEKQPPSPSTEKAKATRPVRRKRMYAGGGGASKRKPSLNKDIGHRGSGVDNSDNSTSTNTKVNSNSSSISASAVARSESTSTSASATATASATTSTATATATATASTGGPPGVAKNMSFASTLYHTNNARVEAISDAGVTLRRSNVKGDGRCLFRALVRCRYVAGLRAQGVAGSSLCRLSEEDEREEADALRLETIGQLQKYRELLATFFVIEGNFTEYIENMCCPATYGGEPELLVLAKLMHIPIAVYISTSRQYRRIQVYGKQYKGDPYRILYSDNVHYDSLLPVDSNEH